MFRKLIVTVVALAALTATAAGAPPPPVTDGSGRVGTWERDPYPRLHAVAEESARNGWPHAATRREAHAVAHRLARREIPAGGGQSGRVLCRPIRVHAGFWLCGVRVWQPDYDADGRTWSYPLVVTVRHDGRWRTTVPGDRYLTSGSRVPVERPDRRGHERQLALRHGGVGHRPSGRAATMIVGPGGDRFGPASRERETPQT